MYETLGIASFTLLVLTLIYRYHVRSLIRARQTADDRMRRQVMWKIAPYVKHRRRDQPGDALRRAAYHAWVGKKITLKERDLFYVDVKNH